MEGLEIVITPWERSQNILFASSILVYIILLFCTKLLFIKTSKRLTFSHVPIMFVFLFSIMFKHDEEFTFSYSLGRTLMISEADYFRGSLFSLYLPDIS